MSTLREPIGATIHNEETISEAVAAMKDGLPRMASILYQEPFVVYVWEVYRSIQTKSLRVRLSDSDGRVHHVNSLDLSLVAPSAGSNHE